MQARFSPVRRHLARRFAARRRVLTAVVVLAAIAGLAPHSASAKEWILGTPVPQRNIMATFIFKLQEGVKKATNGQFTIRYKQDFNEQRISDQLQRGRLQMAYVSATGVGVAVPEAAVLNVPFLWKSDAERNYVTDKYVTPMLSRIMETKGLKLVRFGEAGWTSFYCKSDKCNDPKTFDGMKVRVSPNAAARAFWGALKVNGVTLPLTETWPALQTGVVDAGDLTFGFYLVTPAAKIAPYYYFSKHSHQPAFFLANLRQWNGLPDKDRQAIMASLPTTGFMRQAIIDDEKPKEVAFKAKGGHAYHFSDAEIEKFRALVLPKHPELIKGYGGQAGALYDAIQKGKAEYAKMHK